MSTTIPLLSKLSRRLNSWLGVCLLSVLSGLASTAQAQSNTGAVTGTVLDSSSGKYLEGAEVSAEGSAARTITERGGTFTLAGLPVGAQTLVFAYPGLESKSQIVQIKAGESAAVAVSLASETVMLEAMSVSTAKEGMAQAQALQKAAVQFKLVAAADQFGPISEGNIGEYLKFLPGVSIDYNVNDARGVSLRGLSTAFTIVAVDGTPMAGTSSVDDTRRFEFEQIAMNNVETTELFKTVTPDLPASATGGFVNFVTKSAFDRQDTSVLTYDLSFTAPSTNLAVQKEGGVWGNQKEYVIRPSLELNYARRINSKLGFNVNYRFSEKYDDSPRTEFTWNTNQNIAAGVPTVFQSPRLQQYNIRDEQKLTHREAFATKVDYLISDSTKLSLSGQWNWYDLKFTQRGPQFALGTGTTTANAATRNGDNFTSGTTGAQIQNGTLFRNKYGTTWHFNSTLTHEFANQSKATLRTYYSYADGQYRDTNKGFVSAVAVMAPGATTYSSFTLSNPMVLGQLPSISLVNGATPVPVDFIRSLRNYTFSNTATGGNLQSRNWTAEDTKRGANGDYLYSFDGLPFPLKIQVGAALDDTKRYIYKPDFRGVVTSITGTALSDLADYNYQSDVAYGFGPIQALDPYKVYRVYGSTLTNLQVEDVRHFNELNTAGFLRADAQVLPDLLVVGGVRWEKREIEANAQSRRTARTVPANVALDYAEWYPSINLKYAPNAFRNIVARGGYSRTVGHPDYSELLPAVVADDPDSVGAQGSISVPDPSLEPFFSNNFDLSTDYYLGRTGVVGVSVFRKEVENYIISRGMTGPEINAVAAAYGYNGADFATGTIKTNSTADSSLQGLELSYAQRFSFLPAPFNGFNVQANFTLTDVDSSDIDTLYSQLRAVSPKTANFILGYRYRAFSSTATVNWVDESLYGGFVSTNYFVGTAGTSTLPDTRFSVNKDELTTVSLKLEYSLNRHVSLYFLVRNLTNNPRKEFIKGYLPENQHVVLPNRYFEFGEPSYTLGIRGTF